MKTDTFRIDGGQGWVGLHNPNYRWNGWASPMFTYETICEIAQWIDDCFGDNSDAGRLVVRDGLVFETNGEETWELQTFVVDGVTYYETNGWVWEADSDFTEEN